jgi:hypothetical protein
MGSKVLPGRDASVYVAKNAACVHVPYETVSNTGGTVRGTYTVWLKRIALRWEVDRCTPGGTGG